MIKARLQVPTFLEGPKAWPGPSAPRGASGTMTSYLRAPMLVVGWKEKKGEKGEE
jgi:hypothetical protein